MMLKPGDRVRIVEGLRYGQEATVIEVVREGKVMVETYDGKHLYYYEDELELVEKGKDTDLLDVKIGE